MLLNSAFTCRIGEAGSHMKVWEPFSKHLLKEIALSHEGLVWILLGANAQKRVKGIDLSQHHVIKAPHPSPLSAYRGFFGSKIFSRTNQKLSVNRQKMNWKIR
jgi:uracil-DNA glycosylase